ncbi:Nucleobase-ascorbate transporter 1 [Hibiscus syriacus]|uniref:Nucleobase-ascorbate transporter 1 n=1 Tax=Hibiscus syriacus TaxID=106335 RepID=A0A6A2XAA2_HIBSY|nr:Nucleobase-ascorbate transporter 1 [Hibiscus syriacus]
MATRTPGTPGNKIDKTPVQHLEAQNQRKRRSSLLFHGNLMFGFLFNVFCSDKVFGPLCVNETVYEGVKNVALSALGGINATIFAYGQTSNGKTYTMRGITEKAVNDIYQHIMNTPERDFTIKISGLEIYNENVRDLLNSESCRSLKLLDDPEKGTVVEKLVEETASNDPSWGTVVMIPSFPVPLMGGTDDDKVRVIQTLLFVEGINTLLQRLFGTQLPTVVGGSYAFMVPIISIIHDTSLLSIEDNHMRFLYTMRAVQGALIVASSIQIILGYSQMWAISTRFFTPLGMVPVIALVGFGLFDRGFPVGRCIEIGLPMLIQFIAFSQMVFIVRGKMESIGENGIEVPLSEGDVCGEELLTWCLELSSVNRGTLVLFSFPTLGFFDFYLLNHCLGSYLVIAKNDCKTILWRSYIVYVSGRFSRKVRVGSCGFGGNGEGKNWEVTAENWGKIE